LRGGCQLAKPQFHLRIAASIAFDRRGQFRKHHRAAEADRQGPLLAAPKPADLRQVILNLVERAARALGQQLAGEREPHSPGGPVDIPAIGHLSADALF